MILPTILFLPLNRFIKNCIIHYIPAMINLIALKTAKVNSQPLRTSLISNLYVTYFIYLFYKPVRGAIPDIYHNHSNLKNSTSIRDSYYWFPCITKSSSVHFAPYGTSVSLIPEPY